MDEVTEKILSQAEAVRRQRRKQDRAVKFRADLAVVGVIDSARRHLAEIQAAAFDCDPLINRAESLGLRKFVDPRPWLENYEQCRSKLLSIPAALEWIESLTEANFAANYSANYPWPDQVRVFINEFFWNQGGNGSGVAATMRHLHGLVEHWVKANPHLVGAENGDGAIIPPDRPSGHRVLTNLGE